MADHNTFSRVKQKSALKFLIAWRCKASEIYRKIVNVEAEDGFSWKMCTNGQNGLEKAGWVLVMKRDQVDWLMW